LVEVYYLEKKPVRDEGPFLKEERDLLNTIARHSGRVIERLESEETLRNSEEMYRTVFENTGNATIIVEEDTTISLVNTKFEKLSGYSKEDVEGKKSWTEFFGRDNLEKLKEYHYKRRIEPKTVPTNYEARFIDRHGNIRDVIINASIIPGTKEALNLFWTSLRRRRRADVSY
jgi:PAS domain S-box-containing protein